LESAIAVRIPLKEKQNMVYSLKREENHAIDIYKNVKQTIIKAVGYITRHERV